MALGLLVPSDLEGQLVPLDLRVMPVILVQREIRVLKDPLVLLAPRALQDPREMLENVALLDQKGLGGFRVHPDPLVVELEEPRFLDQKALGVPLVLPDPRAIKASKVPLDPLVLPEQMGNQDPRVRMEQLVPLDLLGHRALPDQLAQQANVVLPDRMQSLLSSISTSLRLRQLRLMARRQMSRMLFVRPTRLRTALGTTRQ